MAREAKLKKPPPSLKPALEPLAQAAAKAPKVKQVVRRNQEHKYLRDGRKLVCRKCGKEHGNLDAVIGCYDAHPAHVKRVAPPNPDPVVAAPRPKPAAPEPVAPAVQAIPKVVTPGDEHKFSRDGARYLCRNCKKKYFTRDDVGKCFDSHAAA